MCNGYGDPTTTTVLATALTAAGDHEPVCWVSRELVPDFLG